MDLQSSLSTKCENPLLYQAIKDNELDKILFLLNNGMDVNAALWKTGDFAGYTALHVACMENKDWLVKLLINNYNANINAVAEDGTHPIHLAFFYEHCTSWISFSTSTLKNSEKIRCLIKAGADVNIEFGREIFTKHTKDEDWCPDFGEKMTLFTYTIVYKKPELTRYLLECNINFKTKSFKNKTLLMYSIEADFLFISCTLMNAIKDPAFMNLQDDDDIPTIHYVLYPKKYNQFRYDSRELRFTSFNKKFIATELIAYGADKYALLNDDPATFLPNVAAYRSCSLLLQDLLIFYESMPFSKVLYNAMLPIEDSVEKMVRLNPRDRPDQYPFFMNRIREKRQATIVVALKDLLIRRTFGLHTNKEEIKLMERLIATDEEIKNIVDDFEGNFINGELKSHFIDVNGNKISVLDFLKQVFDDKKLKLWASDETNCKWGRDINRMNPFYDNYNWLYYLSYERIKNGCEKFKLLKKLEKVSILRKFINLPYEIVLNFIEYLNNNELNAFINAFMC